MTEQEKFEAHIGSRSYQAKQFNFRKAIGGKRDGKYVHGFTQQHWMTWQAAIAAAEKEEVWTG